MGAINSAGGSVAGQAGKRIEFQSELDLTDPANLAAARAFIDGVNPATGNPVDLAQATIDLYDRFDADAATNVRLYDVNRTEMGVDVDGTVLGLGREVQLDRREPDRRLVRPRPGGASSPGSTARGRWGNAARSDSPRARARRLRQRA